MSNGNIIKRLVSSPVVQAVLIYISGGWVALEITDYIIQNYGMNTRVRDVLSIILLIGLPVVIVLAWYLSRDKRGTRAEVSSKKDEIPHQKTWTNLWKRKWIVLPAAVLVLLLILTGVRTLHQKAKVRWAMNEIMPQLEVMVHDWDYVGAFKLRQEIRGFIADDPEFQRLDTLITNKLTILTEPPGADIYYKDYLNLEEEWTYLGKTPVVEVEMPNWTILMWKLENQGYETCYAAAPTNTDTLFRTLFKEGELPEGMVWVEGIDDQLNQNYLSREKQGFYIDRYEVTNEQFKEFTDTGGYREPSYWKHPFILNGEMLSFEQAIKYFTDQTGRPGPAGWEAGDYPDGTGNYPVNGISWYEAAAYAVFAGKELPTNEHWRSATGMPIFSFNYLMGSHVLPLSNMDGDGPEPVGSHQGMSCFGTFDMAGNVREWCWNSVGDRKVVRGGAWNDVSYMASNVSQLPPFDRSLKNGFRCVILPDREMISEEVFQPIEITEARDYYAETPATDVEYQIMRNQFQYDNQELNSLVEEVNDSAEDWILEKISFDAAYEQERMIAYLFLPRNAAPPYQTIVYFPGSNALSTPSIFKYGTTSRNLYYLLKNGRAVMFPIYKGTFERRGETCTSVTPVMTHQFTECTIKWVKDFRRSIDYLESREDIDIGHLAYLGDSWGARLGSLIPAVEDRIRLNIMLRGGFRKTQSFPEVDELNYVTRVKVPTLMLNGWYDFTFPYETTVKPLFDLLGTPEEDKKLVLADTDHFIPTSLMIGEVLDWLDKYFGPVHH